jgi:hypothetical protein
MSGKLTALTYMQHVHSIACRNIEMASYCFRASHPITTYSYEPHDQQQCYEFNAFLPTYTKSALVYTTNAHAHSYMVFD